MQPKFTLRNLGLSCVKVFALAMIFLLSSQFSYSQQPIQRERPKPVINKQEAKPLTKLQLEQHKTVGAVSSFSDNDAGVPNRTILDGNNPQTEAVCTTFTGALTATDMNMPLRMFRNGAAFATTCAAAGIFPGTAGAGPYFFDTYTYVNPQAVTQCITVTLRTNDLVNANIQSAAYLGTFNPNNLAMNYLGDPGVSTGIPAAAAGLPFAFNAPGGASIVFVVFHTNPSAFASDYSLTIDGICTPCVPVNASVPTISSVPSTTCVGTPITLSILSGSLNGAANWVWYANGCGMGAPVGMGTSITVSPVANTTYFARGEGGCAPAPGMCGSQLVTVTPCTCITPDLATICAGSVQRLMVNQTMAPTMSAPFSAPGAITIPALGNGSPYPATLSVAGVPGGATISSVTLTGFSHTFPADVDIALRSPSGQTVILMSDAGGGTPATNINLTFNDGASALLPAALVSGTFRPTNIGVPDNFPAPGPGSISQATPLLSSISGSANGTWELFAVDDLGGDMGSISGGFSITFNVPATTATWSPVAGLFTNPNGTGAYVMGMATSVVYASPAATSTYTATVNNGPCMGANTVTVNVLAAPVVSVSPNPGGCSPATLTASGASIYNWSPAMGLNTTTGATVIATTPVNATYTVNGIGMNGCPAAPVNVMVTGSSTAAVITSLGAPPTIVFSEGFEAATIPAGWAQQNLSTPIGTVPAFIFGTATVLSPAQNGTANSYVLGNFNNVAGANTISNWLFTPVTTLANGDQLTFFTRTVAAPAFPDRLQVRMSTNGASVNVGATNVSVGDFTALLLDINPGLTTTGYPAGWTMFTATVSGLAMPISGRLAFRYFVTNGGPAGANSDNVGIDNVQYLRPALATCANTTSTIRVDITGGVGPFDLTYTNGTTNTTFNGYVSGTPIQVSPAVTTTYTIVSVRGSNGCFGSGNTGSAVITVTPPPSITTQPPNRAICDAQNTTFTVTAGPSLGTTYQWQISTNGGTSYTNLMNAAPYSGVTTTTLTITGVTVALNANRYRVVVMGACPPSMVTSTGGILTVNIPPTVTTQPANTTRCVGTAASFTVVAAGNTPTYQWQVSSNNGLTFTNIAGATAATFTIASAAITMNNNLYQAVVTVAPCTMTVTTVPARLTVNTLPVITIASPITQLIPGRTTTITATTNPAPLTATSFVWTRNAVVVPGAINSTVPVNIDGLGTYRATVTDVNGCVASSSNLIIDAEASDRLFIYPNPTDGVFQVRLYYPTDVVEQRTVSVWNSNGQMVARKRFDFVRGVSPYYSINFDLTSLSAGTYLVKVTEKGTGRIIGGLIVIQ